MLLIYRIRMGKPNYPTCKYIQRDEKEQAEAAAPLVTSDIACPNCGRMLVEKTGRFGKFLACPGYPECKYIHKAAAKSTGIKCPTCGKGEIGEKKSKKGIFYGCNNYPACKFTLPSKPVGRDCPVCKSLLIEAVSKGEVTGVRCSNRECTYVEQLLPAANTPKPKTRPA